MTSSGISGSDAQHAFGRLHLSLRRWAHDQGWQSLNDIQIRSTEEIMSDSRDVLISAPTAAGKTEAAFLPILSLAAEAERGSGGGMRDIRGGFDPMAEERERKQVRKGIRVLCVSPLKALINDQYSRLEEMCERVGMAVQRWHGDVAGSVKKKVREDPSGVLLITPESLEAMFVNWGYDVAAVLGSLSHVVIDEMHSFMGNVRGAQLQSLLKRVDLSTGRSAVRVGLSATLGDLSAAQRFLRPCGPRDVVIIEDRTSRADCDIEMRGYVCNEDPEQEDSTAGTACREIAGHIFDSFRGSDNLVFANSKRNVEIYADLLREESENRKMRCEFLAHHGNLSKGIREDVERMLKDPLRSTTAVCTSTLEMGIDIGTVSSVAQIGPPPSVASLRQRVGRSGRRGDDPALRMYVSEKPAADASFIEERLRCTTVHAIATVNLMERGWLESPDGTEPNYSTLAQQIMSTIAERGGASASGLYQALCGPGPFESVDKDRFKRLLRSMAAHDLLTQSVDGTLLLGLKGERYVGHYNFYAAFRSETEWRLVADGEEIGTLPIRHPVFVGMLLIFAGRRWIVMDADDESRTIELELSVAGRVPWFSGDMPATGREVRQEMLRVYRRGDVPVWADPACGQFLNEGREEFSRMELNDVSVVHDGRCLFIVPWDGDKAMHAAAIALQGGDIKAAVAGHVICIENASAGELKGAIGNILSAQMPSSRDLGRLVKNKEIDKWDWVLDGVMASESAGTRLLDVSGGYSLLGRVYCELV